MTNVVKARRWWNEADNATIDAVVEDAPPTPSLDQLDAQIRSAQHFVDHCEAELARAKADLQTHRDAMKERLSELGFKVGDA